MSGNADAGRVGRALRRITNSIFDDVALDETTSPKVTMVTTNRPELTRTWRGYPETLLPLKHFESNMVRIVT